MTIGKVYGNSISSYPSRIYTIGILLTVFFGFMDTLLVILVISSFILNQLVLRYFVSQLSKKISSIDKPIQNIEKESDSLKDLFNTTIKKNQFVESPNNLPEEDTNLIDLNDTNFTNFPTNLKMELEGGDTTIPPQYNEKAN